MNISRPVLSEEQFREISRSVRCDCIRITTLFFFGCAISSAWVSLLIFKEVFLVHSALASSLFVFMVPVGLSDWLRIGSKAHPSRIVRNRSSTRFHRSRPPQARVFGGRLLPKYLSARVRSTYFADGNVRPELETLSTRFPAHLSVHLTRVQVFGCRYLPKYRYHQKTKRSKPGRRYIVVFRDIVKSCV